MYYDYKLDGEEIEVNGSTYYVTGEISGKLEQDFDNNAQGWDRVKVTIEEVAYLNEDGNCEDVTGDLKLTGEIAHYIESEHSIYLDTKI